MRHNRAARTGVAEDETVLVLSDLSRDHLEPVELGGFLELHALYRLPFCGGCGGGSGGGGGDGVGGSGGGWWRW